MHSPRAIKTRAWFYILSFTGAIMLISLAVLAVGYYVVAVSDLKSSLVKVAKEMVNNRLTVEQGEIKFKLDTEGRTLSAYLRDVNMSAVIFNKNNNTLAEYGIFAKEGEVENVAEKVTSEYIETTTKSGEKYLLLSVPILVNNEKQGRLVVGTPMQIVGQLGKVGGILVVIVLILCLLMSWPISHQLVRIVFRSVDDVVMAMEKTEIENLGEKLRYNGDKRDEIGMIVETYNRLLERLAKGVEKQKSFISNASHELKTPLARIVSTLDLIGWDKNNLEEQKQIKAIQNELIQLSKKVDSLLALSKYDMGNTTPKESIFPKKIVERVVNDNKIQIEKMALTTTIEIDESLEISGDRVGFELAVANIISNAVKYNKKGGEVKIVGERNNGQYWLKVSDEGKGMSSAEKERVFDRFWRSSSQSESSGFGIGMSLVKQICDKNNWVVRYEKSDSEGTEVVLILKM
jgi:signal transduction histidine kinase